MPSGDLSEASPDEYCDAQVDAVVAERDRGLLGELASHRGGLEGERVSNT